MSKPRLSIIIPTYNRRDRLQQSLSNYLETTVQDIEFIIVDNASPDTTADYVHSVMKTDSRIKFFKNPTNLGFTRNLFRTYLESSGDFIMILSDDDHIHIDTIPYIMSTITQHPTIGCIAFQLNNDSGVDCRPLLPETTRLSPSPKSARIMALASGNATGLTLNKRYITNEMWELDKMIYPQVKIATLLSVKYDSVYVVSNKNFITMQGHNDTIYDGCFGAMNRPWDAGFHDRINIALQVSKQEKWSDFDLQSLVTVLITSSAGFFIDFLAYSRKDAFKFLKILFSHPYIKHKVWAWVLFVRGVFIRKCTMSIMIPILIKAMISTIPFMFLPQNLTSFYFLYRYKKKYK